MFSFNRFSLLMRRFFALDSRDLMVNFTVMFGIATALIGISMGIAAYQRALDAANSAEFFASLQRGIFTTYVLISGSVFSSLIFIDYGKKDAAIANLLLPATMFEKWLSSFVLTTVYFLAAVTAAFCLAEVLNIAFFNGVQGVRLPLAAVAGIFDGDLLRYTLGKFAAVHAIYFLGAIHFKKEHWWRTTLCLMAFLAACGLVEWAFQSAWPEGVSVREALGQWVADVKKEGTFRLPVGPWASAQRVLGWSAPPVLWALSYLKLTEKQV